MNDLKTYEIDSSLESKTLAIIKTNKGEIKIPLFLKDAPQAVANFVHLAESNFYDGLNFHRVIAGFMAQGGCPNGDGRGGPGWRIKCELKDNKNKHLKGTLSMAHAGRDTGGSQFFICFVPCPHLDGEHTVFGRIDPKDEESLKVLDSIKQGDVIESIRIEGENNE